MASALMPLQAQKPVPEMRQYVDTMFNFSFWYPAAWTVKRDARVTNPTNSGWYRGGRVVARLSIVNRHKPDDTGNDTDSVEIEVLSVPSGELTELGSRDTSNPVAADQSYSFNTRTHNPGGDPDEAMQTMDGHPISYGASRHLAEVIVPLDRAHFLSLGTSDPGGNMNHLYLAETILAGPHGATHPTNQADVIHLAAVKLGVIGQRVGLGYWAKDNDHVYNSQWKIIPGVSPTTFRSLSEDGPSAFFATDGTHVFEANGTVIPGADPKTFKSAASGSASDAHHTYEWNDGQLKIDGVAMRKEASSGRPPLP